MVQLYCEEGEFDDEKQSCLDNSSASLLIYLKTGLNPLEASKSSPACSHV